MATLPLEIDDTDVPLIRDMVHARLDDDQLDDPAVIAWLKADLIQHINMRVANHQHNVAKQLVVIDLPIIT